MNLNLMSGRLQAQADKTVPKMTPQTHTQIPVRQLTNSSIDPRLKTKVNIAKSRIPPTTTKTTDMHERLERQFLYSRPSSIQMRKQIEEVKGKMKDFSLTDCLDKIQWLANIAIEQQLDLDLFKASASSMEQWTFEELKKLKKFSKELTILSVQKKKLDKEKSGLEAEKAGLTKANSSLEKELQSLRQLKEKYTELMKETEELREDKENSQKRIEKLLADREKYANFVDPKRLSDAVAERDLIRKKANGLLNDKLDMRKRIRELEEMLSTEKKTDNRDGGVEELKKKFFDEKMAMRQQIRELEEQLEKRHPVESQSLDSGSSANKKMRKEEEDQLREDGATLRQIRKELTTKNIELTRLRSELQEKEEQSKEDKSVVDKAKHKVMELREKLRRKREESEKAVEELKEEQAKRERAESEVELLRKNEGLGQIEEFRSTSTDKSDEEANRVENVLERLKEEQEKREKAEREMSRMEMELNRLRSKIAEEESKNVPEIVPLPSELFNIRLREMMAKKEQMDRAFTELQGRKCEKCQELKKELANLKNKQNLHSTSQQHQEQPQTTPNGARNRSCENCQRLDTELNIACQKIAKMLEELSAKNVEIADLKKLGNDEVQIENRKNKPRKVLAGIIVQEKLSATDQVPVEEVQATSSGQSRSSSSMIEEQQVRPISEEPPAVQPALLSVGRKRPRDKSTESTEEDEQPSKRQRSATPPQTIIIDDDDEMDPINQTIAHLLTPRQSSAAIVKHETQQQQQQSDVASTHTAIHSTASPSPALSLASNSSTQPQPSSSPLPDAQPVQVQAVPDSRASSAPVNNVALFPTAGQQNSPRPNSIAGLIASSPQPTQRTAASTPIQNQHPMLQSMLQNQQQQPTVSPLPVPVIAARIVTDFMIFIGERQNINANACQLIPEFLRRRNLPPDHLIAAELAVIANESEIAKGVRGGHQ